MKQSIAIASIIFFTACNNGESAKGKGDTTNTSAGISDGISTTGNDTARMDTTLGNIKADSAK